MVRGDARFDSIGKAVLQVRIQQENQGHLAYMYTEVPGLFQSKLGILEAGDTLRIGQLGESLRSMSCRGFAIPNTTKTPPLSKRNGVQIISPLRPLLRVHRYVRKSTPKLHFSQVSRGIAGCHSTIKPRPVGAEGFDWKGRAWCYAAFLRSSLDSSWNGIVYLSFKVLSLCKANTLQRSFAENS